jgi:hypothetical protein
MEISCSCRSPPHDLAVLRTGRDRQPTIPLDEPRKVKTQHAACRVDRRFHRRARKGENVLAPITIKAVPLREFITALRARFRRFPTERPRKRDRANMGRLHRRPACRPARVGSREPELSLLSAIGVSPTQRGIAMRLFAVILSLLLGSTSFSLAQSSGGSSGGAAGGAASSGAGSGSAGNTLSNGSTISGTGGSPGSNTSNALNHGTTGNNLGANQTGPGTASSSSPAVNTPAANSAVNSLSNTNTGILKK